MSIVKGEGVSPDGGIFRPQLTSLVDVMTILLVFLIKSFSVEGNIITPSEDLLLPVSTSEKPPRPRCSIEITRQAVLCEGQTIESVADIAAADSLMIPSLFSWMQLQRAKGTDTADVKEVMIQCDREVEFNIVKKVMYTCSRAGFMDYSVLVLQEE